MSVKKIIVRDGMSYDTDQFDPGVDCGYDQETGEELPSRTKQSFRDECDINNIMRRYETTGVIQHVAGSVPEFGDYISELDFQQSMNAVLEAQELFAQLPARVRDRFGNDPAQMLAFLGDEKNKDEAIKLGLVNPPAAEPPPQRVEVVNPAPPPAPSTPQPKAP
nr:MAG: internal scaffolding protein [Microvirus sp.]